MDSPSTRPNIDPYLAAGLVFFALIFAAANDARAQTRAQRRGAAATHGTKQGPGTPGSEPSQANRESMRRSVEKRRQRRASRVQRTGGSGLVGEIVSWPMPPALIIRQTPQVRDEIESLFRLLRK